ncbi:beta-N-acetylhexosaminidase [Plantibacter cousiniae (nom. nud.)]|uniref:beta-N-acetylhexosaminidase n=1 Tax=Plantibacter cousiniae (nom. nud.) TaxID=199709 RepID=UPI001DFB17A3|nr:beta-N-acetylhexosaminidase [Plantibacter cousiniae]CAH0220234.1 Beta-N-acetylhexosaminidase [Plantibacter cousiniae]
MSLLPRPVSQTTDASAPPFRLSADSVIRTDPSVATTARILADALRTSTGFALPVETNGTEEVVDSAGTDITLSIDPRLSTTSGAYRLTAAASGVEIVGADADGVHHGTQTLRQLLPAANWAPTAGAQDWIISATVIDDAPRFAYRGAMLDVARHFFTVAQVQRFIDQIAALKLNHLHLHLTDDQGWRLEIAGWPELTGIGAATAVGGGTGGSYSADDYRAIIEYAADRRVTIVPEIDVPGHTNAVLSAYPDLNPDGVAREPYTGTEVGFSSLDIHAESTYTFLEDVFTQLAAMTPGPYLHLGGDEALATTEEDFLHFARRVSELVATTGKTAIAWHEFGASRDLDPGTIGQYWNYVSPEDGHADKLRSFVDQGGRVIMSPADAAYLDMQYPDVATAGLTWADGPTSVERSAVWEPTEIVEGVGEQDILGVEAPLWTETVADVQTLEFLVFPRVASIAEIGWSERRAPDWSDFRVRLAELAQGWSAAGIAFHRSPEVSWLD